jgi:hypothetical protein
MIQGSFVVLALGLITPASAHPFHLCTGEMRWKADTERWEVGLKIHPQDLIRAIEAKTGKKIDLDGKKDVEVMSNYMASQFYFDFGKDANSVQKVSETEFTAIRERFKWVGLEEEKGWVWIYFELSTPKMEKGGEAESLWLTNQLLLDAIDKQENSVLLKRGEERLSLQFSEQQRSAEIPSNFIEVIQ